MELIFPISSLLTSPSLLCGWSDGLEQSPGCTTTDASEPICSIPIWPFKPTIVWAMLDLERYWVDYLEGTLYNYCCNYTNIQYTTHDLILVAIESLGPINSTGLGFLQDCCHRRRATPTRWNTSYLFQRLSICTQRLDAVVFRVSFEQHFGDENLLRSSIVFEPRNYFYLGRQQ